MFPLNLSQKLAILNDATRYDASCASSRAMRHDRNGLGSTEGAGTCHRYPSDTPGASLSNTLNTKFYIHDGACCTNRLSPNVQSACSSLDYFAHAFIPTQGKSAFGLTDSEKFRARFAPPPD